jgi:V-type H+-transporting ATPase subunit D
MSGEREQVFATRMVLQTYKGKCKGAMKGFELLKKKADALKARIQKMIRAIHTLKLSIGNDVKAAHLALAKATYAAGGGGFIKRVLENEHRATIRIDGKVENVAGVKIAKFASTDDVDIDSTKMSEMYGLSGGGAQINKAKEEFANLLEKLIQLASLQTAFKTLDEALKVTSRRVNALDNVVVPRLENTVNYVKQELDELEREDFTRLKKVVEKKNENEENNELEDGSKYQSESLESSNLGPSILDSYGNNDEADEDLLF